MRDYLAIWNTTVAEKENVSKIGLNPRYEANTYLRNASGDRGENPSLLNVNIKANLTV